MNSKQEMLDALLAGHTLINSAGSEAWFDLNERNSPFRFKYVDSAKDESLSYGWNDYKSLEVKKAWYENLGEGVICWISDKCPTLKNRIGLIVSYGKGDQMPFKSANNISYRYATPLTKEDLEKYGCNN